MSDTANTWTIGEVYNGQCEIQTGDILLLTIKQPHEIRARRWPYLALEGKFFLPANLCRLNADGTDVVSRTDVYPNREALRDLRATFVTVPSEQLKQIAANLLAHSANCRDRRTTKILTAAAQALIERAEA
jgi:hypothetical protein